eukprot:3687494-Amphidinium_carterae.1
MPGPAQQDDEKQKPTEERSRKEKKRRASNVFACATQWFWLFNERQKQKHGWLKWAKRYCSEVFSDVDDNTPRRRTTETKGVGKNTNAKPSTVLSCKSPPR